MTDEVEATEEEEFNLGGVAWDEGSDNPFGLDPGIHRVTISEAKVTRGKPKNGAARGNLGMWLTFSNEDDESIRRWVSLPEEGQDRATKKRNISWLRVLNNNLEIPEDRWESLKVSDYEGLRCVIEVTKQKDNPEYMQVKSIAIDHGDAEETHSAFDSLATVNTPSNGGFDF